MSCFKREVGGGNHKNLSVARPLHKRNDINWVEEAHVVHFEATNLCVVAFDWL
jgi:hypothetical protein